MKSYILNLLFLSVFVSAFSQNTPVVKTINTKAMEKVLQNKAIQTIDVRTEQEFNAGHIGHAKNMNIYNLESFKKQVSKLNKAKPVYVYCQVGGRSNYASKILKDMGFKDIYDYSGGWSAWRSK